MLWKQEIARLFSGSFRWVGMVGVFLVHSQLINGVLESRLCWNLFFFAQQKNKNVYVNCKWMRSY